MPFVVDNTNPSRDDRRMYLDQVLRKNQFTVSGYYFQSKIEECLKRNRRRSKQERVPDIGLRGTHSKLELPSLEEGFHELSFVKMKADGQFLVEPWSDEV
jgi:predicted kinase